MEREFLKKLVIQCFNQFAKDNGFIHRKGTYWYRINDGILISIGFEADSNGYKALYSVQPLYRFSEYWILTYGDTVSRRNPVNCKELQLYKSHTENEITNNLNHIKDCFKRTIIPTLNAITDARTFIAVASASPDFFFCGDLLLGPIAYSEAYCGMFDIAKKHFSEYVTADGRNPALCIEPLKVLELLEEQPEKAVEFLRSNVERSIEAQKLKI